MKDQIAVHGNQKKKKKSLLLFAFKLLSSLFLLYYVFTAKVDFIDIWEKLKTVSVPLILAAFSFHIIGFWLSAVRWKDLLKIQNIESRVTRLMEYYIVSQFFNVLIPGRYGGDVSRIYDTAKQSREMEKSIAVIIIERGSGLFILLLFGLFSTLYRIVTNHGEVDQSKLISLFFLFLLFSLGLVFMFLLVHPKTAGYFKWLFRINIIKKLSHNRVKKFREALSIYWSSPAKLLKIMFLSFLLQLNVIIHYYFISLSFGIREISFLDHFIFIPLLLLVLIIPLSFAGLGLRDLSVIKSFEVLGSNAQSGGAFAIADFLMQILQGFLGGILFSVRGLYKSGAKAKEEGSDG